MGARMTGPARSGAPERRPWHGAAFIVEALVLLAFLMGALAVVVQLMGAAYERGAQAQRLSDAIVLASNDAEAFAATPVEGGAETAFALVDGELVELPSASDAPDGAATYLVTRVAEAHGQAGGTLYTARIDVSCDGEAAYSLETARYVAGTGAAR